MVHGEMGDLEGIEDYGEGEEEGEEEGQHD